MEKTILKPQPGPQEKFLSSSADICIYGGAAGGGKTYALLLEPLRHINNKDFSALIFRRESTQISAVGGLWDTSKEIYPLLNAEPKITPRYTWTFPSGAKVAFGHLNYEDDKYGWQGSQITLLCFDELTHFTESQFFYMLSRNRSAKSGIKPYVRATTNPEADSWVADFIKWWIDPETGYPIPERSGVIRYMARYNDIIYWFDTIEQFNEFRDSLGAEASTLLPKTVTFIASKLSDNKILMENDPGYIANLLAMDNVNKERLLNGNWKIVPSAGEVFPRAKANIIEVLPSNIVRYVRAWDLAATEDKKKAKEQGRHAKTAGVLLAKTSNGRYIVVDVINKALSAENVRKTVLNTAKIDKHTYKNVRVRVTKDPAQAGKDQAEQYIKLLAGFNVVAVQESGDKETRAEGFAAQWQAGNVDILLADWNKEYLDQMDAFPESFLKDMVDASSNAFNEIESMNTSHVPKSGGVMNRDSYWNALY